VNLDPSPFPTINLSFLALVNPPDASRFIAPLFSLPYKPFFVSNRFSSPLFLHSYKSLFPQTLWYENDLSCPGVFLFALPTCLRGEAPTLVPLCCVFSPSLCVFSNLRTLWRSWLSFGGLFLCFQALADSFCKIGRVGYPHLLCDLCALRVSALFFRFSGPRNRLSTFNCRLSTSLPQC
jgi:hypothetical protein